MSLVVGPASYMGGDQSRPADLSLRRPPRPQLEFACGGGGDAKVVSELGLGSGLKNKFTGRDSSDTASSSSSSIGRPDDDDDDDTDDEVQSTLSLGSLEDSLPIKRGLSKHYAGKSKSFGNLGEVRCVNEMVKADNPFNKRRRTLMALNLHNTNSNTVLNKRKKKSSAFYAHSSHISMPLLPLAEDEDDNNNDDDDDDDGDVFDDNSSDENSMPSFRLSKCRGGGLQQIQEQGTSSFNSIHLISSSSSSVNVRQTG